MATYIGRYQVQIEKHNCTIFTQCYDTNGKRSVITNGVLKQNRLLQQSIKPYTSIVSLFAKALPR